MPKKLRVRKRRAKKASPRRARTVKTDHEQLIDGCDLEFQESAPTPDAELPAARGGIEIIGSRRRRVR
jgi:hypothetical protein